MRGTRRLGGALVAFGLLLGCSPAPSHPRAFKAGSSCPFPGSGFGAVTLGADVVVSLFELDALRQLRMSDCAEQKRWAVDPGPRALIVLGGKPAQLAAAASGATALTLASLGGASTSLGTTSTPFALAGADLDGDGQQELIGTLGTTAADAGVGVWRAENGALGQLQELPLTGASALAAADLDGDGDVDVAAARTTEHRVTLLDNAGGKLTLGQDLEVCDEPFSVTSASLGHARPSLVVTCRTGGLELLHPAARGYTHQRLARTGTLYETVAGDFDLDGLPDLASVDPFGHRLVLWWGKSGGQFEAPDEVATGRGPILLRTFDSDIDGGLDLLVLAFQDRTVTVFRNAPGASR